MKKVAKVFQWILIVLLAADAVILLIRWINGNEKKKLSQVRESTKSLYTYAEGMDWNDFSASTLKDISIEEIKGKTIAGYRLKPKEILHKGSVIVFGGSEGSVNPALATYIASLGYEVYAMYVYGQDNQPAELIRVPVEMFAELKEYVHTSAVSPEPLTLVGSSKGAEYALLLASIYPEDIDHVVLYAPSSHIWQGLSFTDRSPKSSWTFHERELDYIRLDEGSGKEFFGMMTDMLLNKPFQYAGVYTAALKAAGSELNRIDTSAATAKLLIFAGAKDGMWPAAEMAQMIKEQYPAECEVHVFEDAGHIFFGPSVVGDLYVGGSYEANEEALVSSNAILAQKLAEWTK